MKRLRRLIRVLGWRQGLAMRLSEIRRAIAPCWGGPFDGEWRFSTTVSVLQYVQAYPSVNGQPPIYSTSMERMARTNGLYVYRPYAGRYEWTALVPLLVDDEAEL